MSAVRADLQIIERFKLFIENLATILAQRFEQYERDRLELMAELGLGDSTDELDEAVA